MRYLLNGQLDAENVRVKSLTAETIDVDQLSALAADLGHITAGLIESIEIFGSYIATANGTYPRAEMSNTENLFRAARSATSDIAMKSSQTGIAGPVQRFTNGSKLTNVLQTDGGLFLISTPDSNIDISSTVGNVNISGGSVTIKGGTPLDSIAPPYSTAITIPELVADFNILVSHLRSMNIFS